MPNGVGRRIAENSVLMPKADSYQDDQDDIKSNGSPDGSTDQSWLLVALVVDRLFAIIYYICFAIILLFLVLKGYS